MLDFAFPYLLQVIAVYPCGCSWVVFRTSVTYVHIFLNPVNSDVIVAYLQFIREYTSKVDELIKDKIEAQNEVKVKEKEEKDLVTQQACLVHS